MTWQTFLVALAIRHRDGLNLAAKSWPLPPVFLLLPPICFIGTPDMRTAKWVSAALPLVAAFIFIASARSASAEPVSIAEKAQKCMNIESNDDRAKCYDAAVK